MRNRFRLLQRRPRLHHGEFSLPISRIASEPQSIEQITSELQHLMSTKALLAQWGESTASIEAEIAHKTTELSALRGEHPDDPFAAKESQFIDEDSDSFRMTSSDDEDPFAAMEAMLAGGDDGAGMEDEPAAHEIDDEPDFPQFELMLGDDY